MSVEGIGNRLAFVWLLIGLATLTFSSAALGQPEQAERQQQPGEQQQPEQQQQEPERQQPQQQPQPEEREAAGEQDVDVAAAAPGEAQEAEPQWNAVRVIRVKGERVGEFEALLKELAAAMSAADMPPYNVWRVELGELNTYHIVGQLESFSELGEMEGEMPMEPAAMANWVNRIESTIEFHEVMVARVHENLSVLPDQQQAGDFPPLMVLLSSTVRPGRSGEFEVWLRDELLPAVQRSDALAFVSNQMVFGTDNRKWVFAVPIQDWSELDQPSPLHRSMGEQAAEEMLMRGDELTERSEAIVLRHRPDLSSPGGGE